VSALALAFLYPLCPFVGWAIGALVKGRPVAGLVWGMLGPPGWLVVLLFYGGALRCPNCASMTPYVPPPDVPPGASFPHLRCRRCGGIVEGL
jgi:hypothetical protein